MSYFKKNKNKLEANSTRSASSSFEKLSFTQAKSFNVPWLTKLKEIPFDLFLEGLTLEGTPLNVSELDTLSDEFEKVKDLRLKEQKHESSSSSRQLFFCQSLHIYYEEQQASEIIKQPLLQTQNQTQTQPQSQSGLRPLSSSYLDFFDDTLYSESDGLLFHILKPYLTSTDDSFIKIDAQLPIINLFIENFSQMNKWVSVISKTESNNFSLESFEILKSQWERLQFRLTVEKSDESSDWKIWGEYFNESENIVIDLWQIKSTWTSFCLTHSNKLYFIDDKSFNSIAFARFFLTKGPLLVSEDELGHFFYELFNFIGFCFYRLSSEILVENKPLIPKKVLYLKTAFQNLNALNKIEAQVWFRYNNFEIPAKCHRSNKRMNVISFKQIKTENDLEKNSSKNYKIKHLIQLFLPSSEHEGSVIEELKNSFQPDGFIFDFKKNVFRINFQKLHQIISTLINFENFKEENSWEVWAENIQIKLLNHFQIMIRSLKNGFFIELQDTHSKKTIESWQLIHILKKKSAFIQLDDGSLGVLPQTWIEQLLLLHKNISGDNVLPFSSILNFMDLDSTCPFPIYGDKEYLEKINKLRSQFLSYESLNGQVPIPLKPSKNFHGQLYDFQCQGLAWLVFLDDFDLGGLLADDMGLGKTVQVLAFLDYLKFNRTSNREIFDIDAITNETQTNEEQTITSTLLIAPKSVLSQWEDSAHQFTPQLKVKILKPKEIRELADNKKNANSKKNLSSFNNYDILITSYGVLRRYINILKKYRFTRIILDEAQMIKNENSKVSLAAKALVSHKRLAISGTPIENHIADFFSLFNFLNPMFLSKNIFLSNIEEQNQKEEEIKAIFKKIKPLILCRKKEVVLTNLPKKKEEIYLLPLKKEQQEIYDELKKHYSDKIDCIESESQFNDYKIYFLEGLLRLRQICCHPLILYSPTETNKELNSSKAEFILKELIKLNNENSKVLVFSQFISFLKIIKTQLSDLNIPFSYLDGQTQDRKTLIDEFQSSKEIKIFLLGLKSGGLGLNLTSANYCIILDPWWNPAVEIQAIDRINRIGQKREIFISRLISKNTIEEKITELHKIKFDQTKYLNTSDKDFLKSLSLQDFKNLFS